MKTRWEKRAEFLKEYTEQKIKYVKETWESQQQIGKWCKTHLLPDKSEEHYKKAYRLRGVQLKTWLAEKKVKAENEIDHRLKIAKWCEKELGLFPEARAEYTAAYELKKTSAGDADAPDTHFNLGRWCETVGLDDEALKEYEEAVGLDAKHNGAKSALTRIHNSIEYKFKQLAVEYDRNARAWHLTVAVEDQADLRFMEEWGKKIQELSKYVFDITEGQFYIADCEIEDASSDGRIIIEKGKMNWRGTGNAQGQGVLAFCIGSGNPDWVVHCAGKNGVGVVAHEIFHGIFGLPDEYYQEPQCECVMRAAPNPQKLCDSSNHIGGGRRPGPEGSEGKDCWKIIMDRKAFNATVRHPNPDWAWAETSSKKPPRRGDDFELRNNGGDLKYRGIRFNEPPKTVIRIIDN
ncbi:MAG: tetratricopeptide repeat protein [Planctomycetes bacterium]|nr:tetratricopeptide repeat protein [Planctomycetota bacterium]